MQTGPLGGASANYAGKVNMLQPGKELEALTPCGGIWTSSCKQQGATEDFRATGTVMWAEQDVRGQEQGGSRKARRTGDERLEGDPAATQPLPWTQLLGSQMLEDQLYSSPQWNVVSQKGKSSLSPTQPQILLLYPWGETSFSSEVDKREEFRRRGATEPPKASYKALILFR